MIDGHDGPVVVGAAVSVAKRARGGTVDRWWVAGGGWLVGGATVSVAKRAKRGGPVVDATVPVAKRAVPPGLDVVHHRDLHGWMISCMYESCMAGPP